jgi:hypothetical protein
MSIGPDSGPSVADPLPGLLRQLEAEYGDDVPSETIDRVAKESLGDFRGAKVRDFVPVFAWRHARQRLRRAS